MARVNHRQVEAFRAVMLTGGMTSAAELLGITQPAVSRLVRDFEASTGVRLFERRGSGVVPTPDATLLLAEVERSFVGLGRVAEAAEAIRTREAGRVRIAALPALATSLLPRLIGRFVRDRPNLRVSLQAMPSHLVVEAIAAGQADFGYANGPAERPGFVVDALPTSAVVILPTGHPLAARARVVPADLAGARLIGVAPGTLFHSRVVSALAGIDRIALTETSWSETACLMVAEGAGIALVDPFATTEFAGRGLVVLPFEPAIDVGIVALRPAQRPISPLGSALMGMLAERIAALTRPRSGACPASGPAA